MRGWAQGRLVAESRELSVVRTFESFLNHNQPVVYQAYDAKDCSTAVIEYPDKDAFVQNDRDRIICKAGLELTLGF